MTTQKHDCRTELKKADLKATPARLGVLAALEESKVPLDASGLLKYLKNHKIKADKATVFRIINILKEKDIVWPIQLNEGKFRYEYRGKGEHHHFVCEKCLAIEDISDCNIDKLEREIKKKKGLLVKRHSLEFFGICQQCQY